MSPLYDCPSLLNIVRTEGGGGAWRKEEGGGRDKRQQCVHN